MAVKDLFVVKAAPSGGPEMGDTLSAFIQQWTQPGKYNQAQLFTLFGGHVYNSIGKVAQSVAKINIRLQQSKSDGDTVEVKRHPFLDLIKRPNPLQSKFTFFEFFQTYALTAGEVFLYMPYGELTKQPKEMYMLRPDRMTVAVDESSDVPALSGYTYTAPNGTRIPLDTWEVKHFKLPNPENPWRGLGPLEAGITYVLTEKYGSEFTRNYIYNNAMPAGVLNLKNNISDPEFKKVKKQFQQEYGSVKNAGKTAILRNADAEFIKIGSTLSEIALTELRNLSRDDIFEMFGTPKPVMSITDDVNRANAEAALYHFAINTIDPAMFRITDFFQSVLDMFDANLSLSYDSPIPRSNDEEIAYNNAAVNSWETVNEIRAKYNLPDIAGGDEIRQPINLVPIDDASTPTTPPAEEPQKSLGKITLRRVKKKTRKLTFPTEIKENFRLELMQKQEAYERRFLKVARQFLHKQKDEVVDKLKVEVTKRTKASGGPDYYFDFNSDNAEFQQMLQPLMTSLIAEQGALALKFAGADNIKFEIDRAMKSAVEASVARMASNFNEQTRDALSSELIDAISSGDPVEDITARVEGVYESATGYRAERIARTETLKGSNYATNEAYRQTGYVISKEWYANPDACEFCADYDGKVVGLETVFASVGETVDGTDGGAYNLDYEDIDVPPLHPNCRCTIIPVTDSGVLSGDVGDE